MEPSTLALIVVFIFIIGFIIFKSTSKANKTNVKTYDEKLSEQIDELKQEIKHIYSTVNSKYNRKTGKVILNPNEFSNLYDDVPDLIEKTEVMVVEYIYMISKENKKYDYSWKYEGLNENNECVYQIIKKAVKPFIGPDTDYINNIENISYTIEYFMSNHRNGEYYFEDVFSRNSVKLCETEDNQYVAELNLTHNEPSLVNNDSITKRANDVFKKYRVDDKTIYRRNIADNPSSGTLFILDTFFKIFELNRVRFTFKTEMNEAFENSHMALDDLNFVFDRFVYLDKLRERLINIQSEETELKKKKRSRVISQNVKDKVWNRDGGKCVECGSNENLEFDHIIPFSKGGANTYRNIQLLCEPCNRKKSSKIG